MGRVSYVRSVRRLDAARGRNGSRSAVLIASSAPTSPTNAGQLLRARQIALACHGLMNDPG